ncbi:MAG: ABC transporter permease [Oscillospiraceae bacterium]|jgi:simple sugar transport system permease protein|nr:ABC transporter permease [Oscillospiraceae bacterium]
MKDIIHITKRPERSALSSLGLIAAALALAVVAGGVFIALMGANPFEVYATILKGAFVGSKRNPLSAIQSTVILFVPLLIVSLGLSLAFKMRFWNIGGEGQMIFGAIFATFFALNYSHLPHIVLVILMFIASIIGGGLWGLIPALFKVKWGVNETLFTLMMNYVALYTIEFLQAGPWQRTQGFASVGSFEANVRLAQVGGVHVGWILALLLTVLVAVYMSRAKQGYEIAVVGESQATARYAGMDVKKVVLRTMFISGAICGVAGMVQIAGTDYTLSTGLTGGVGFSGITVAWLAKLNPFAVAVIAALFSILEKGSKTIPVDVMSSEASRVLQGILLFVFLGAEFFRCYAIKLRLPPKKSASAAQEGEEQTDG